LATIILIKKTFLLLYPDAHAKVFTLEKICSGFKGAGLKPFNPEHVLSKLTFQLHTPTPAPSLVEGSVSSTFQTPQNTRQLDQKVRSLQNSLNRKQQLSSSPITHIQYLEKAVQMAMQTQLLLEQEIKNLQAENRQQHQRKARKHAELGNNQLLNIQEGQNQVQQLDTQFNEQPEESTPMPRRRAPQRCSGCGTVGHTIRNCPIK
jgi:hypothetical protein